MAEIILRCRICNSAVEVSEADILPATEVLASDHPDVPMPETYVVLYTRRESAMAAIQSSGFVDETMEIPKFIRPPGWSAKYN